MGRHRKHVVWLGLTPEPERELPVAVAALRQAAARRKAPAAVDSVAPVHSDSAAAAWQDAEVARIERLILHGTQRGWLRYLAEVTALITRAAAERRDETSTRLALHAAETVLDHHRMLIGLPGPAYERVAAERDALAATVTGLRERLTSS
jgi:hypothetical protein